jgi:outer membrane protein OmpA-like peptidoglycan-associated protein
MNPPVSNSIKRFLALASLAAFLAAGASSSLSAETNLEPGAISIDGKLQLDYYYHRTGDKWDANPSGYKGTNYKHTYSANITTSAAWSGTFGETLFLNFGARPYENLSGDFGFEFIGDYSDRYWMPLNYEHRMKADALNASWTRADVKYSAEWWDVRYFRGAGHYNWNYEGDLFGLFPEQFETAKYLRLTGRPVPEGIEANMEGSAGKFTLFHGPELIWDYKNATYAKYNFFISRVNTTVLYADHIIPYGDPDERMRSFEISSKINLFQRPLEMGVLYRPFRLDRAYDYVEDVGAGNGDYGSQYKKKSGITASGDAVGYSVKYGLGYNPIFNDITLKYKYQGISAGNLQETSFSAYRKLTRSLLGSLDGAFRKPVLGPIPLLYEGTSSNLGPALFEPRGPSSPFWVDWDNREATKYSLVLTYDPTPDTWFYQYEPNLPDEWNLSPNENAAFSCAARYTLAKYNTTTDRLYYYDSYGSVVWEAADAAGAWATDNYIGYFTLLGKILKGRTSMLVDFGFGDQLAKSSYAYRTATTKEKAITNSFTSGLTFGYKPYKLKLRYGQDVWGPEEWHQTFGQTFDKLYQVDITRDFGEYINLGVGYTGAREEDLKYFAEELGDYDEIHCCLTIAFGPLVGYFGTKPADGDGGKLIGEAPPQDNIPPQARMKITRAEFTPGAEGAEELPIELFATDENGISKWAVTITDQNDKLVKTIAGAGDPPYSVDWDGTDDVYQKTVPEGKYNILFEAFDTNDNSSKADPATLSVVIPPKVVVREVTKEVTVTETDRGLKVSLTSNVLFDSGKSKLKPSAGKALLEVVKILAAYPDNKISVEGHTDNIGSVKTNQKLSEERAKSVADFLKSKGVHEDKISIKGLGKEKPAASNSTAAGREANRRVEVIILKK